MPFYSAFQVWALESVLRATTLTITLDKITGTNSEEVDWNDRFRHLRAEALDKITHSCSGVEFAAIPILCQLISNRYLPEALSNQRTLSVGGVSRFGGWIVYDSGEWDWQDCCDNWVAADHVAPFALDEQSLERAHWQMVTAMHQCDPLWEWRNLLQFVNQTKRDKLRGDALRAELYRQCAEMLRSLYRDLYQTDLGPPEDALHGTPSLIPEPEVRDDPREHLQYVVNQYELNPQPKAVLFVEGESEVAFLEKIFSDAFGMHYGIAGIEVINLTGIGNVTGTKKEDRYNAIFRLADYHFEHQTLVFIMLDNENRAKKLEKDALSKRSTFGSRRLAIPNSPERIRVWDKNFELDNFDDEEIARALDSVADQGTSFAAEEIQEVRSDWPRASLSLLFKDRTERGLTKPKLADALADVTIGSPTRMDGTERPIVEFLLRVRREASRNPLPLTQDDWRRNQEFLDAEVRES